LAAFCALAMVLTVSACTDKAVRTVERAIDRIGTVTLGSLKDIENAESDFTALTDSQRREVSNRDVLIAARDSLNDLLVERVDKAITMIGTVSLGSESDIAEAENLYSSLDYSLRAKVSGVDVLTASRTQLEALVVKPVEDQIAALGPVTLDSEEAVSQAEAAFNKLPEYRKKIVGNQDALVAARASLEQLKAAEAQRIAEERAAQEAEAARKAQQAEQAKQRQKAKSQPAPQPAQNPAPAGDSGGSAYYKNCTAVCKAGKAPLHRGDPGYRAPLDRDNDGIACEICPK
jgi:hypothetical protein